jgi:hypothetical protein
MNRSFAIILGALPLSACGKPCDDPTRINGDWLVQTSLNTPRDLLVGQNIEGHPLEEASILSPTMPWSALFQGTSKEVELQIGQDLHYGTYAEDPEDCDGFTLTIDSIYQVKELDEGGLVNGGTQHDFLYEAKLRYTGPRITGTFRYQDEWTGLVDDEMGSLTVDGSDFIATQVE